MNIIYLSCEDLLLYNFIKLSTSKNLSWLLINKNDKLPENAEEVWEGILEEYSALCGDLKSTHMLSLAKEIAILTNQLSCIQIIVTSLAERHSVDLCDVLKEMGYRYEYSDQSLLGDLQKVVSSAKMLNFQRVETQSEYDSLNVSSNQKETTEADFYTQILHLSKFLGYKMDPKETTVMEFAIAIDQFNKANTPKKHG